MSFLRLPTLFIILYIVSTEANERIIRHGTELHPHVNAQFSQVPQPQQQVPQYQYPTQGSPQIQFAPPGQQQYPLPPQNVQQIQYPRPGNQQYQYQYPPAAPNRYQQPQQGAGVYGAPYNPNFPQPRPSVPTRYVTFKPITMSPTPIPFQSLDEAQPIKLSSSGLPTWVLRFLLLQMVQKSTIDTTTTTTTAATPYVIPGTYSDWYKFGNCVYKSSSTPKTWDEAKAECVGVGARLATVNVKQSASRNTIFGQTSLSTGVAWVGLEDIDGSTTPFLPRWLDFATFVPGTSTVTYTTTPGTRSCANVGVAGAFTFTNCGAETQKYLCEFCPTF